MGNQWPVDFKASNKGKKETIKPSALGRDVSLKLTMFGGSPPPHQTQTAVYSNLIRGVRPQLSKSARASTASICSSCLEKRETIFSSKFDSL